MAMVGCGGLQVRNVELLKLRFGESNLHFCEVMIKDVADSRRINGVITSEMKREKEVRMCVAIPPTGWLEGQTLRNSHVHICMPFLHGSL